MVHEDDSVRHPVAVQPLISNDSPNFKQIVNKNHVIKVKTQEFEDDRELIILVSTLGRSGSSWVGELLSLINNNTLYVYEPLIMIQKIYGERLTNALLLEILQDVLRCQMKIDIVKLNSMWSRVLMKFKENCGEECDSLNGINNYCARAKTLVVKVSKM